MSIRLKIVGVQKREKSKLIWFATCRSFYTKEFRSFWCGARCLPARLETQVT
jgi:hypothetical protein